MYLFARIDYKIVVESLWIGLCRHCQEETGRKSGQLLVIVSIFVSEKILDHSLRNGVKVIKQQ